MTLERANKDLLICTPSSILRPWALFFDTLSLPARSIKLISLLSVQEASFCGVSMIVKLILKIAWLLEDRSFYFVEDTVQLLFPCSRY